MTPAGPASVTALLERFRAGDDAARNLLLERLAVRMAPVARRLMGQEPPGHTLQPTALVNEALARLIFQGVLAAASDRAYLYGAAARAMRQVLADHARADAALKRGGGMDRVPLSGEVLGAAAPGLGLVELHDALEALARVDERASHVVTLRFLADCTVAETAEALGVSASTAEADWRFARAWLLRQLGGEKSAPGQGD